MAAQLELYSNGKDNVNSPSHYTVAKLECIDAIKEATGEGYEYYLQGVIMKYLWRYRHKGTPVEDLQKAENYLKRLIKVTQNAKEHK